MIYDGIFQCFASDVKASYQSAVAFEGTCNTFMFGFNIESQELTDILTDIYVYIYIYIYMHIYIYR